MSHEMSVKSKVKRVVKINTFWIKLLKGGGKLLHGSYFVIIQLDDLSYTQPGKSCMNVFQLTYGLTWIIQKLYFNEEKEWRNISIIDLVEDNNWICARYNWIK